MEKDLILEIGTEEIPAGFLNPAIENLKEITINTLRENHLQFNKIETFGTPRRLISHVTDIPTKQRDIKFEKIGPPIRISFDENNKPTKAALGFAKSQGLRVDELDIIKNENGEFLGARQEIKGEKTEKLLKNVIPKIINSLHFKKSMRWGTYHISFARPIRWILSVYDGKTISFKVADVISSNKTYGHRFLSPKPLKISSWTDFKSKMDNSSVIFDQEKRGMIIKNDLSKIVKQLNGILYEDEELLETVVNLVEIPQTLVGSFSKEFLKLPIEVLISVMKNHQKYFPILSKESGGKRLLPNFIFISGTPVKDTDVVVKGNERVIHARFNDARFFYHEDTKDHLISKIENLKHMVFLSDLGTYYDKIIRTESIVELLAELLNIEDKTNDLKRAAKLSKADLTTQMVFEFPELQGTMGKYYAIESGEKSEVAKAIEEHYWPTARTGELPESDIGAILSIADKFDTIISCFIKGLNPTGTSDPYALRRQAIGIINTSLQKEFSYSFIKITDKDTSLLVKLTKKINDEELRAVAEKIHEFFKERFRNIMTSAGYESDIIDAVLSSNFENFLEEKNKIDALSEFRKEKDFDQLAVAFKRVVNIAKEKPSHDIDNKLLNEKHELELVKSFFDKKNIIEENFEKKNYRASLLKMKELKTPIDNFFDNVLVMDNNVEIRNNRLSILWNIRNLFFKIADFSKIST